MFLRLPTLFAFACGLFLWSGVVSAKQPDGLYLDGGQSKIGVILLHGRNRGNGDADDLVVRPLRKTIHERLGAHTLSLNYPQSKNSQSAAEDLRLFPDAYARIDDAIKFLTEEKGVTQLYFMGHSEGARISTYYLVSHSVTNARGYIGAGVVGSPCQRTKEDPEDQLSSNCSLSKILTKTPSFPVIDVVAMKGNQGDAFFADQRKRFISPTYQQVRLEDANHGFTAHERELTNAVVDWLKRQSDELKPAHWLVGIWKGQLPETTGKGDSTRTLNVTSVGPDGSIQGGFGGQVPQMNIASAKFSDSGETVTIELKNGIHLEFAKNGALLVGMVANPNGNSVPLELSKTDGAISSAGAAKGSEASPGAADGFFKGKKGKKGPGE